VRILNIYADAEGETHFRQKDIECADEKPWGNVSQRLPATSVSFVEATGTRVAQSLAQPHPAPCRQDVIVLEGEVEVTNSDGESRVIGPGEVVLVEDTAGKGRVTKILGQKLHRGIFVPLD
jgi:mannose-6-phosphate isomerase-like protein (cupin superfamily)